MAVREFRPVHGWTIQLVGGGGIAGVNRALSESSMGEMAQTSESVQIGERVHIGEGLRIGERVQICEGVQVVGGDW